MPNLGQFAVLFRSLLSWRTFGITSIPKLRKDAYWMPIGCELRVVARAKTGKTPGCSYERSLRTGTKMSTSGLRSRGAGHLRGMPAYVDAPLSRPSSAYPNRIGTLYRCAGAAMKTPNPAAQCFCVTFSGAASKAD